MLLPEDGDTFNQLALSLTDQLTFEAIEKLVFPALELTLWDAGVTASELDVEEEPDCVIVAVLVIPPPETVTVAVLELELEFTPKLAVIVALLFSDVGLTLNQLALDFAVQFTFEDTLKFVFPADEPTF